MSAKRRYITTPFRALSSFFIAAMVGGILTSLAFTAPEILNYTPNTDFPMKQILSGAGLIAVIGSFIWLFGLVFIGGPVWMLLHGVTQRSPVTAVLVGGILSFGTVFANRTGLFTGNSDLRSYSTGGRDIVIEGKLTNAGWINALELSVMVGIIGVIVAFTLWRVSYRRNTHT
jgi:hypothetical protein